MTGKKWSTSDDKRRRDVFRRIEEAEQRRDDPNTDLMDQRHADGAAADDFYNRERGSK